MNDDNALNQQCSHWERTYAGNQDKFGTSPSEPAIKAAELFKSRGVKSILELGGGQGRDTIYFAQNGFDVHVLDYSHAGIASIQKKAQLMGLSHKITATRHDARERFPFDEESFDACYSHMFFCMALTIKQLENVSQEILRTLKPGGINIFTTRNTDDIHFGTGIHRGEGMYEVNGFIVHFLSKEQVEHLAKGFKILAIDEFEEGDLPRKLFRATSEKA
ncbi:MAG: class I SAM-dependent methyltransferase [Defluviitaleaceae bacterium]|nr:class I SAM-dependent methyltransferase [Defluviitaleaceae bacterium]MCL2235956.1 class I SAM-dependent methyltransferase [Defluviitaleaceae bacterium]